MSSRPTSGAAVSTASLVSPERFNSRIEEAEMVSQVATLMHDQKLTEFGAVASAILNNASLYQNFYKIPLPPIAGTGVGYASDYEDRSYTLRAGLANIRTIDNVWRKHRATKDRYRVLDFGCGTGRLLRYVCEFGEGVEPIGCEVNPKSVAWLQSVFPCAIHQIERPYSLHFLVEPVELIYAWSIFTHFSEDEHLRWLRTLTGALAPGGVLIATFKSPAMLERAVRDDAYRKRSLIANDQMPELMQRARENGFVFFECYDDAQSSEHGIDATTFGQTYISHDYIRDRWSEFGDVVEIDVAVPDWQDLVALRAP